MGLRPKLDRKGRVPILGQNGFSIAPIVVADGFVVNNPHVQTVMVRVNDLFH